MDAFVDDLASAVAVMAARRGNLLSAAGVKGACLDPGTVQKPAFPSPSTLLSYRNPDYLSRKAS